MYPVKIFDGKGNLKQTMTAEEVSAQHWTGFKCNVTSFIIEGSTPHKGKTRKKKMKDLMCVVCGAPFQSTHIKAKYCNHVCATTAGREKHRIRQRAGGLQSNLDRKINKNSWKVVCQWRKCGKETIAHSPMARYCNEKHKYFEKTAREKEHVRKC